jgi:hypothetical protein
MSAQTTLTIEAKVLGQRRPTLSNWQLALPPTAPPDFPLTLRQLLALIVTREVEVFHQRQTERRLLRVLSLARIAEGAARGKIEAGGQEETSTASVAEAIATALQSFEDHLYFVLLDGARLEDLDAPVPLREESHLTFVRLVALVGG